MEQAYRRYEQHDVDSMTASAVQALGGTVTLNWNQTIKWRPHAVLSGDHLTAIHVHAVPELSRFWLEKFTEASRVTGCRIVVAAPIELLLNGATLDGLDEAGIEVLPLEEFQTKWTARGTLSVYKLVYSNRWALGTEVVQAMLARGINRLAVQSSTHARGRILEEFLAFIFSQVDGFEVEATDYRTETEEVDIVLSNRVVARRIWGSMHSPIVLVEAKNWTPPIPRHVLTEFREKMATRRGMCQLGFLVTTGRFSSDLLTHELRYSMNDGVVTLVDGESLRSLCVNFDITNYLESLVVKAIMR